jgi:hypothetical protein
MESHNPKAQAAAGITRTAVRLPRSCRRPTSHKWLASSLRQDFNICQVDIFYLQVYLDSRLTLVFGDCTVLEGFVFKEHALYLRAMQGVFGLVKFQ